MTEATPTFEEIVAWLRSDDQMTYEKGYVSLLGRVDQFKGELLQLMLQEQNPSMRAKFIELLGESDDPSLIAVLQRELSHPSDEVKGWALSALENFAERGFSAADSLAKQFRSENSEWS